MLLAASLRAQTPVIVSWTENSPARLVVEWQRHLKDLDPAAARFLRRSATAIELVHPRPGLFHHPAEFARYEDGVVFVNVDILRGFARQVFPLAEPEDAHRILALMTLPTISHELSHGMTRAEMKDDLGFDYPLGSKEDELIAFYRQALATRRLYQRHGAELGLYPLSLNLSNRSVLMSLRIGGLRGFGGLENRVLMGYPDYPYIASLDRERYLAWIEAAALRGLSPAGRKKVEGARLVLADGKRFRRLRNFYLDKIASIERRRKSSGFVAGLLGR